MIDTAEMVHEAEGLIVSSEFDDERGGLARLGQEEAPPYIDL